jgi:septal ring factor EnvC (AmiA/AmiB activator)
MRFFAENSKFSENLQEQLADAEADRDKFQHLYNEEKKSSLAIAKERNEQQAENIKITAEVNNLKNENEELKKQLTELKAKLYDLMTA